MNLRNLSKRIAREVTPNEFDEREIEVTRQSSVADFPGLRRETRRQVEYLQAQFNRNFPNDIDFYLYLGEAGIRLSVEYLDGPHANMSIPVTRRIDDRFIAELPRTDWDSLRGFMLTQMSLQDRAAEEATNHPVQIQPSCETQREFFTQFSDFILDAKVNAYRFAVLAVRHDEDYTTPEFETITPEDRQTLVFDIADLMTVGFRIVAVVIDSAPITPPEIEAIKGEALDCLGPISRAKAEGRFGDAFAAIMNGGSTPHR